MSFQRTNETKSLECRCSGNDDSTCDMSMSTMNTEPSDLLFERSLTEPGFGSSLDLDRHVAEERITRFRGEDSEDFSLGESFAMDDGHQSRRNVSVPMNFLETVYDDEDDEGSIILEELEGPIEQLISNAPNSLRMETQES